MAQVVLLRIQLPDHNAPTRVGRVRVALLARTASEQQEFPDKSAATQLQRLRTYAQSLGWHVVAEVAESKTSGRAADRPGLAGILNLAEEEQRPFELLLVENLSRLSRDPVQLHQILSRLAGRGIAIHVAV